MSTLARFAPPGREPIPSRLWKVAGGFALAHVVLLFIGLSQQSPASLSDGPEGVEEAYGDASIVSMYTGGTIELLGFLSLLVATVFIARAIGRRTEAGRWAAQTGLMAGVGYITATFATGLPAGAAAVYGAQHGLDFETVFAINNVRNFAYFVSLMLLGAQTISIAVAALSDGVGTRWLGWGGLVTGTVLVAAPALASVGQQDWTTLLWLVWWIGVAVFMLRHKPTAAFNDDSGHAQQESSGGVTDPAAMRHA